MLAVAPMDDGLPNIDRFRIVRQLGRGGMGIVYEAVDTSSGETVALKTLQEEGGLNLMLLKNEFRALADLSHPNLAALHELHFEQGTAFLTMELIEGRDFISSLRGAGHPPAASWLDGQTRSLGLRPDDTLPVAQSPEVPAPEARPLPGEAYEGLRASLGQVAEGLAALHASRRLHRDVKPTNVLVTDAGRAVVLDFGLVTELAGAAGAAGSGDGIAGSVPYMSPEQAAASELTPASDWYAFGAMLYEALVGHPPFTGPVAAVLAAKQTSRPIPPSDLVDDVPLDLEALCLGLLERDPARRPSGADVLARLGRGDAAKRLRESTRGAQPLIGRADELALLGASLADVRSGRPAIVHVRGRSGMGKSTLCHAFLDGVSDALVLRARCFERDSVPFKALDPLVDQLARWLVTLPTAHVTAILPRYVRALARLFPVLRQVAAVEESDQRTAPAPDPREERRRAFGALRELLARVSERETVVVLLDDLQWGDHDSGELLHELIRPPDPPSMLLVASFRIENEEASPLLRSMREDVAALGVRTVDVEPLGGEQATELARQILRSKGLAGGELDAAARQVAEEGAGSPFFLTELAWWGAGSGAPLDGLVRERAADQPPVAHGLLRAIALAAVPIPRRIALAAAGVRERGTESMTLLENARFVRGEGPALDDRVECYHDRIREAVVDGMDETGRRDLHVRIARALEEAGGGDAELLVDHFLRGGRNADAARHARVAVAQATEALAFDRAAAMLRLLLELEAPSPAERRDLFEELGQVLKHAGRSPEAADAVAQAAALTEGRGRRKLQIEEAGLRVVSGQFDQGRPLVLDVLRQVGLRVPRSRLGLVVGILWARLRTRLRGIRRTDRDDDAVPVDEHERLELLVGGGFGSITTDQFLAFYLLARFIPRALGHGTRSQQVWALAAESFVAQIEPGGDKRGAAAFAEAEALAERIGDSEGLALACVYRGVALIQLGLFKRALVLMERARQLLEEHVVGGTSNLGWVRMFLVAGQGMDGRIEECVSNFYELLEDARSRNDKALEVHLVLGAFVQPPLMGGDPDAAEAALEDALAVWGRSEDEFDLQHFYGLMSRVRVLLYRGAGPEAWQLIDDRRRDIRRSGAMRSGANVRLYRTAEAAAAVAAAGVTAEPGARRRFLKRADKLTRRLMKTGHSGPAFGGVIGAGAALALGRPDLARAPLAHAHWSRENDRMRIGAFLARVHRAHLFGDDAQLARAYEELGALGIRDPVRWTRSWAPLLEDPTG